MTGLSNNLEKKLKHLDFLQLVITRMNVNSFLVKGWSVTLVAAMFAFAAKDANAKYGLITLLITGIFWILDGYYLSQERQYRVLFDVIRLEDEINIDFDMDARPYATGRCTWWSSIFAFTLCVFYVTILSLSIVISLIIR
jgi:hypothetical protein